MLKKAKLHARGENEANGYDLVDAGDIHVELDSAQIIPTKDDYDFFITNTNKALEAGIDSAKLFSEGADSPYANIIAVRAEDKDNPAIKALVYVLLDEDTQKFIEETYDGAVIPVK